MFLKNAFGPWAEKNYPVNTMIIVVISGRGSVDPSLCNLLAVLTTPHNGCNQCGDFSHELFPDCFTSHGVK